MTPQIILADPYLVDGSGHCYPYFEAVRRALTRQGRASVIVGSRAARSDFLAARNVEGGFDGRVREWRPSNIFFGAMFRHNLRALDRAHNLTHETQLIFNSLRPFHLAPLARWLRRRRPEHRPRVTSLLHFAPRRALEERLYREGFAELSLLPPQAGFRLLVDTVDLQELFSTFTDLPIGLAPIPSTFEGLAIPERAQGPLRLVFAGEARWDKGFDLLPAAAEALAARPHLNAELVVQAFNPEAKTESFLSTVAALREKGAILIESPLSFVDYGALIRSADIMLLPYSAPHYRFQSSGVFIDAVLSGAVTVAPTSTWMGGYIAKQGGGSLFAEVTKDGLRRAIEHALDAFEPLSRQARSNVAPAKAFHNVESLLRVLTAEERLQA